MEVGGWRVPEMGWDKTRREREGSVASLYGGGDKDVVDWREFVEEVRSVSSQGGAGEGGSWSGGRDWEPMVILG